ncbi:hypothetical protein GCM10007036_44930 [Alsobacter metallidurans]|uniref:Uncharacterized protein n=1 Tax=Alsobacter metallidurans TaxID=340221 RepID=A0A917IAK3_9HYPH|nr:hypothetical protein [Alsobacter metallidurans]GGH32767.1 hypothetical protein GCM10007036_44930 [Alsobacter metallidurans]
MREIHRWQGASGQWYDHGVHPFAQVHCAAANFIMVRRERNGACSPLYIGEAADFHQRFLCDPKRLAALAMGANEIHILLGGASTDRRARIDFDLRRAHPTPLNQRAGSGA